MNIAVIFAGGVGQRMHSKSLPKQFLELHGKPIIIYTLEEFDSHCGIDGIVVSCLEAWIPYLEGLAKKFSIRKIRAIVPGGETGQDSIYNGLRGAAGCFPEDSVVLVHDAVRPVINAELVTRNIETARAFGNAVTVSQAVETIAVKGEGGIVGEILDRGRCQLAKAPQCFILRDILAAHEEARREGRHDFVDSASLMRHYGHTLHPVEGGPDNIKITTPTDFYTFRAIIEARENCQVFGWETGVGHE